MKTIFLSPHFDDAVLSCGGLIWEMSRSGNQVEVWTVCAGLPLSSELSDYAQEMHDRWELSVDEAVQARKFEDQAALEKLGVTGRYINFLDAIYRRHPKTGDFLYTADVDLFGGIQPGDQENLHRLAIDLAAGFLEEKVVVIAPLTVGNHVDHIMVRSAAERLPVRISYYPDYPYMRQYADIVEGLVPAGYSSSQHWVSDDGLAAWQESVGKYRSQISTFWESNEEMKTDIARHRDNYKGVTLWERDY